MRLWQIGKIMNRFGLYIDKGYLDAISKEELDRVVQQYDWFSLGRLARVVTTGEHDSRLRLPMMCRAMGSLLIAPNNGRDLVRATTDDIIDKFLTVSDYRIVAEEGDAPDVAQQVYAERDDDDDFVTEELAQIYASQGLYSQAIEIYRKLSLRNSEKSVYFAEIIAQLEQKELK